MKINILYWDNGDKQRLDNTNLSWLYLKKFAKAATDNGYDLKPFLFDFSEVQILPDAIHIPYEKGSYKRSEKINKVIEYHGGEEDYFSIMDSDLIIRESDYDAMQYFIRTSKPNKFSVFKLDDLINLKGVDFIGGSIDFEAVETVEREMEPDLGALFFIHNKAFKEVGGFDERFTVWGGEDNEISYRLQNAGYKKVVLPIKPLHLPHNHALEEKDLEQYKKQVQLLS